MVKSSGKKVTAKEMELELAKARVRGLMQVIERIINRHTRGECWLDEKTFKLYEIAKRISWANNNEEFLIAIGPLGSL